MISDSLLKQILSTKTTVSTENQCLVSASAVHQDADISWEDQVRSAYRLEACSVQTGILFSRHSVRLRDVINE